MEKKELFNRTKNADGITMSEETKTMYKIDAMLTDVLFLMANMQECGLVKEFGLVRDAENAKEAVDKALFLTAQLREYFTDGMLEKTNYQFT